ncbi:MAG: translation initiation factor IF-2 [Anaerolineaceae bacterium]|nr:translation initiation factor IF-2 [Anaerolineaceae bacterium]
MAQEKQAILLPEFVTVRELADIIGASPIEVMKRLIANGIMASINQQVDFDTAAIVAEEMGFEAQSAAAIAVEEEKQKAVEAQTWRKKYADEKPESLVRRPPIVTILGHVDHGKTTLLDTIRKSTVAAGEAGGITQHIGAYRVIHNGNQITFLDTPGHEAFTAMRARGAQGADVAILVVAADDGVMQTTREALTHAQAANVPVVVAITKTDKRNANVENVKKMLADIGLTPDEWGGDTLVVPVSAQQGTGLDDLLEAVLLTAEDKEIVANPKGEPSGITLEAELSSHQGTMATLLVLNGTLKRGDIVVAGQAYGRVKAMFDENGKKLEEAGPSTPVRVLGLSEPPQPGDTFETVRNDKAARLLAEERRDANAAGALRFERSFTLEDVFAQFESGKTKELALVLKVDVQGSLQPIVDGLKNISGNNKDGITIRILSADVGNISENDVNLASASGAIIVGFSVNVDNAAHRTADSMGVEIRLYNIIYKLFEDIELALQGMLEPVYADKNIGTAEVRQIFKIPKAGTVAGSYVRDGELRRNAKVRVKRANKIIAENLTVASLKREKEDVREVRSGFECGVSLNNFDSFVVGDMLEFYVSERVN